MDADKERQEIRRWKKCFVTTAKYQLKKDEDYSDSASVRASYGYFDLSEGNQVTALLKITTDKKSLYYKVRGRAMSRINEPFAEDHYQDLIDKYLGEYKAKEDMKRTEREWYRENSKNCIIVRYNEDGTTTKIAVKRDQNNSTKNVDIEKTERTGLLSKLLPWGHKRHKKKER